MAEQLQAGIYGTFQGSPPFGTGLGDPARTLFWDTPIQMGFPTHSVVIHQVNPGVRVAQTSNYIYSVIEVPASGLNVHSTKYVSNTTAATLVTNSNV